MTFRRHLPIAALLTALLILAAPAHAATPQAAPDNTAVNRQDRAAAAPTADNARETASDRDIAQNIRKAVIADDALSTYAKNVKIIAQDGKVTLKGPVRSEDEKQRVADEAAQIAGEANVTNNLTVASK